MNSHDGLLGERVTHMTIVHVRTTTMFNVPHVEASSLNAHEANHVFGDGS